MSFDPMNNLADLAELGFDLNASVTDRTAAVDDGQYLVKLSSEPVPTKAQDGKAYSKLIEGEEYAGKAFFPSSDNGKYRIGKDGRVNYSVPVKVEVLTEPVPGKEPGVRQTLRTQYITTAIINKSSGVLDAMKAINRAAGQEVFDIPAIVRVGMANPIHVYRPLAEALAEFLQLNPGFTVEALIQSKLIKVTSKTDQFGVKSVEREAVRECSTSERIKAKYPKEWAGQVDFPEGLQVETSVRTFCFRNAGEVA